MAIWRRAAAAILVVGLAGSPALATTTGQYYWCDTSTGFAIAGFDPVAYFVDRMPRQGSAEHEYVWQGVTWRFVSEANRAVFERDPEVYAPQYGGYGAERVAAGALSEGSPVIWSIIGDRLYFFTTEARLELWREGARARKRRADINWPKLNRRLVRE